MKKRLITYTKIGFILVISYFIAGGANEGLFRDNTPRLQADIPERTMQGLRMTWNQTSYIVASLFNQESGVSPQEQQRVVREVETAEDNELAEESYTPLIKGVSAKETDGYNYVVVRDGEVEWKEYTITIDGEQLKIKVPAGQDLPPSHVLQ
ncbi:MAG: hypothetical protein ACOCXQ_02460 [Patescibacteria group bacterium]